MELLEVARKKFGEVEAVVSGYTFKIIWCSKEFHELLGYNDGELIDVNITKVMKLDSYSLTKKAIAAIGGRTEDVVVLHKKDGTTMNLKATLIMFVYKGEPHAAVTKAIELKDS